MEDLYQKMTAFFIEYSNFFDDFLNKKNEYKQTYKKLIDETIEKSPFNRGAVYIKDGDLRGINVFDGLCGREALMDELQPKIDDVGFRFYSPQIWYYTNKRMSPSKHIRAPHYNYDFKFCKLGDENKWLLHPNDSYQKFSNMLFNEFELNDMFRARIFHTFFTLVFLLGKWGCDVDFEDLFMHRTLVNSRLGKGTLKLKFTIQKNGKTFKGMIAFLGNYDCEIEIGGYSSKNEKIFLLQDFVDNALVFNFAING